MTIQDLRTVARTLRTGQFWYLFPHYLYRWIRNRDIEQTPALSTVPYGERGEVPELHVLSGASSIGDLLYAAKSFVAQYEAPLTLVVQGDGTLTKSNKRRINRHFPKGKVFTKGGRNRKTLPYLEKRDLRNCKAFREANVFGMRLVDTAVLAKSRMIINMDTDCLSLAPLSRLQSLVSEETVAYVRDPQARPYSISDQNAKERFGVEPVRHFNAGLCAFPRERLSLHRIEEWLSAPGYPMETHYAEQTILAALAALGPSQVLPREKYAVGSREGPEAFVHYADHYLSETRVAMRRDGQKRVLRHLQTHS